MLDPNKHQGLIIPKNFTFSYRQDKMPDKVPCVNSPNPTEEKVWVKVEGMYVSVCSLFSLIWRALITKLNV